MPFSLRPMTFFGLLTIMPAAAIILNKPHGVTSRFGVFVPVKSGDMQGVVRRPHERGEPSDWRDVSRLAYLCNSRLHGQTTSLLFKTSTGLNPSPCMDSRSGLAGRNSYHKTIDERCLAHAIVLNENVIGDRQISHFTILVKCFGYQLCKSSASCDC